MNTNRLFKEASLHQPPNTAEDGLRLNVSFPFSREHYDQNLYIESARRVVFKNCMEKCELDDATVPNFNKNFYYNQEAAQVCLQSCFNFRMQAHFGKQAAEELDGLQFDFAAMKREYQNYERWHPDNEIHDRYMQGYKEQQIQDMVQRLKAKTQQERSGRFDFQ